jgi:hypothetical protein
MSLGAIIIGARKQVSLSVCPRPLEPTAQNQPKPSGRRFHSSRLLLLLLHKPQAREAGFGATVGRGGGGRKKERSMYPYHSYSQRNDGNSNNNIIILFYM